MDGSLVRGLIGSVFNAVVVFSLHYFGGMSSSTTWLTFLGLTGFLCAALLADQLYESERKLDHMQEVLAQILARLDR